MRNIYILFLFIDVFYSNAQFEKIGMTNSQLINSISEQPCKNSNNVIWYCSENNSSLGYFIKNNIVSSLMYKNEFNSKDEADKSIIELIQMLNNKYGKGEKTTEDKYVWVYGKFLISTYSKYLEEKYYTGWIASPINIDSTIINKDSESKKIDEKTNSITVDLNKIPIDKLNKEQCFLLLDKMVKDCNGKNMTSKNYTQFQGSFTSDGYAILTDYKIHDDRDLTLVVCRNIKWETLYSISTNQLNFQYSCVCLKFPPGYYCYRQIARTTDSEFSNKILNNKNPITLNEKEFGYRVIQNPYNAGDNFTINLKNQDVNKFVELIKRVSIIEREKEKNIKQNLIYKEKWNGNILIKWHEDSDGNQQGRYEEYNDKGNLVTYGNYRNNIKEDKWVINGVEKNFPTFIAESCFCN